MHDGHDVHSSSIVRPTCTPPLASYAPVAFLAYTSSVLAPRVSRLLLLIRGPQLLLVEP